MFLSYLSCFSVCHANVRERYINIKRLVLGYGVEIWSLHAWLLCQKHITRKMESVFVWRWKTVKLDSMVDWLLDFDVGLD